MEDITKRIQELQGIVDTKQKERERLLGHVEAAEKQLKEAGFDTVEDATAFIEKETKALEDAEAELRADMEEFDNEYADQLEG